MFWELNFDASLIVWVPRKISQLFIHFSINDFLKLNENIPLVKTAFCFSFFEGFHGETRARLWTGCTFHATELGGFDTFSVQTGRGLVPRAGGVCAWPGAALEDPCGSLEHRIFFGSVIKFKSIDDSVFLHSQVQSG